MTSTPEQLASAARELALAALHEITPASTVGPIAGYTVEDSGALSLRFENRLRGYPGWYWTVSVAQLDDAEPTVLEAELMPGDGALLAPDWVPWAERLADYRAHQAELAEQAAAAGVESESSDADGNTEDGDDGEVDDADLDDADLDDTDDLDDNDFDEDGSPHLHGGDLDGVDIDELDEDASDDDSDDDDDDDDSDDDDSDGDDEEE
ncbi:hypothetical protein QF046_003399 [Microbacterium sp. W4I4]|uniref:DUF3027 domain-containing protein n=1 Tax=Microbacterium sp. W4I4 TaxID=3042295 RepID=UPI00277F1471|nr:DUF3027 domain-containing protein [Microbacterium sp. W4I4]MDQ0615758.1 hypothetical protein [Microbacterium sp. W4I4]